MGRLRRREIIPEHTPITATVNDPKAIHGQFGRQVQAQMRVIEGDYRGTEFRTWFSFGKDDEDGQEFVPYGGALYSVLSLVAPNIDEVLDDENLTEKKYQAFVKKAVKDLDGIKIMARVGVKTSKSNPEKKNNTLKPDTLGLFEDPDEALDADMAEAPF